MVMDKLAPVRILRNLHINVRREVKDTTVKEEGHFTYEGSEIENDKVGQNLTNYKRNIME
jgi:hypothetical protein